VRNGDDVHGSADEAVEEEQRDRRLVGAADDELRSAEEEDDDHENDTGRRPGPLPAHCIWTARRRAARSTSCLASTWLCSPPPRS
jgi:hypothetical protein